MATLVTGGCGFIGSHLVEALAARGETVRVFDNLSSGRVENLAACRERVELVRGDLRDADALARAAAGVERVFHLAALVSVFDAVARPAENHDVNLTGTFRLFEAARAAGVRRIVFASSAAVYGNAQPPPHAETLTPRPESPYAVAKLAGEHMAAVWSRLYGLETVSLRFFNVYGPRQGADSPYSGVISRFAACFTAGQRPTVFGDGRQSRDFVFVADVVQACLLAMDSASAAQGDPINIGTGGRTSLLELLGAMREIAGRDPGVDFQPAREGDIRHSQADIARARQRLGYAPRFTIREGLARLFEESR